MRVAVVLSVLITAAFQTAWTAPSFGGGGDISKFDIFMPEGTSPRAMIATRLKARASQTARLATSRGGELSTETLKSLSLFKARYDVLLRVAKRVGKADATDARGILAIVDSLKRDVVDGRGYQALSDAELAATDELRMLENNLFTILDRNQ